MRELLTDSGVKPSKVGYKKEYKNTEEHGFRIYGFNNLLTFMKTINFTHILKSKKLTKIIKLYNKLN